LSDVDLRELAKSKDNRTLIKALVRAVTKLQNVTNPRDVVEIKNILRADNDDVLIGSEATNTTDAIVTDPNLKLYQLPHEPDGQYLTLWNRYLDFAVPASALPPGQTIVDSSGFDNHGSMTEAPASMSVGHAASMGALFYDGVDTKYTIGDNPNINATMNSTPGFTICMWIKPNSVGLHGGQTRVIACKVDDDPSSQNNGWSIWLEPDGTIVFSVKKDGIIRTTTDTGAISILGTRWYFIVCSFDTTTNTPNLYVDGIHANETISGTIPPRFPTSGGSLTLFVGGTDAVGAGYFHGGISDFRFWKNKLLTSTEIGYQNTNKYTILNISNVAIVGVSQTGSDTGTPAPPTETSLFSFSALSFTSDSFTIDRATGQGGNFGTTPSQFYDDFRNNATYELTTFAETSPDLKWKVDTVPGTGGYIKVEDFTGQGENLQNRLLRLKTGTANPNLRTNTATFDDLYMAVTIRTLTQDSVSANNRAQISFKYQDVNNRWTVVLSTTQISIIRTNSGTATTVAQSSATTNFFPLLQKCRVEIWVEEGGNRVTVSVDGATSGTGFLTTYSGGVPVDSIITANLPVCLRSQSSESTFDNILIRPLFGSGFQESTWSITSGNSPDGKWTVQTAAGTGGFIRTFDYGTTGDAARALNLDRGTADPILLSTPAWANYRVYASCRTISQDSVSTNNRAQLIFKWKDSSNYYYVLVHPTGWSIRRVVAAGADELVASGSTAHADNQYHKIEVRIYNGGKDIELWTGVNLGTLTLRYEDHTNDFGSDDGGILSGSGKIGFRAVSCVASFDNVAVKPL
jgi:concanavalin A-like lectin/glucanase superfamily protein